MECFLNFSLMLVRVAYSDQLTAFDSQFLRSKCRVASDQKRRIASEMLSARSFLKIMHVCQCIEDFPPWSVPGWLKLTVYIITVNSE